MSSVRENFTNAVFVLVGPGVAKQRLEFAWRTHLDQIEAEDLPEALRTEYLSLKSAMHAAAPCGDLGEIETSVRKMTEQQAGTYATSILRLFGRLPYSPRRRSQSGVVAAIRAVSGQD